VLEALRALVNGLYAAVVDLLRPRSAEARREASRKAEEAQVSRKEAEEAFRELRSELRRDVERWREMWKREAEKRGYWGGPDREWLKERLWEFIDDYVHLIEKILSYKDLKDKFADAVEKETYGLITWSDAMKALEELA
jgi:vacuolar-type H+-ATPase subunit I/STV1